MKSGRKKIQVSAPVNIVPEGTWSLAALTVISIVINYYVRLAVVRDLWFISLLLFYLRSKDEAFWLAYILILNDGIAGFFGIRGVQITSLPLPDFEITHLYLLAVIYKVISNRYRASVFYDRWLKFLGAYLLFLIYIGFSQGIPEEYSILFRTIRSIFPFLLFYFLPRIINNHKEYERFFSFVFLIVIVAFATQVISVIFGLSPPSMLGLNEIGTVEDLSKQTWRGLFNIAANIIGFFAALFYLSSKKTVFNRSYLQFVLVAIYGTVFFSATRGWIIGLGISLLVYFIFVQKVSLRQIIGFGVIAFLVLQLVIIHPRMRLQLENSVRRTLTMESVLQGDLTAGGTSSRANIQAPKVMSVWAEKPLLGWGFSDTYFQNYNIHVGNQTILLHAGILGAALLIFFIVFFFRKLYILSVRSRSWNCYSVSLLMFPLSFLGWFFIHSTSGQQFGFTTSYIYAIPQAVFLSFGAFIYSETMKTLRRRKLMEKRIIMTDNNRGMQAGSKGNEEQKQVQ